MRDMIAKHPWWATIGVILAADAAILGSASAADATGHTPITFCHNEHTITTDDDGFLQGHLHHGDTLGPCNIPTPTPTEEVTPSPTPTSTPTEEPSPSPSTSTSTPVVTEPTPSEPVPTGTPSPSTSQTVIPPVSSESPTSDVTSLPSSSPTSTSAPTGPGLAETGMNTAQGLALAGSISLVGYLAFMFASKRRETTDANE